MWKLWVVLGVVALIILGGWYWLMTPSAPVSAPEAAPATTTAPVVATTTPAPAPAPAPKPTPKPAPAPTPAPAPAPTTTTQPAPAPAPAPNYGGNWQGTFTARAPAQCSGYSGTWSATLYDTNGTITGNFTASDGTSGSIVGTAKDGHLSLTEMSGGANQGGLEWDVENNAITSGTFSRTRECYAGSGPVTGVIAGHK